MYLAKMKVCYNYDKTSLFLSVQREREMAINLYELICPEKNMDSHFLNASSAGRESYTKSVVDGIQTFVCRAYMGLCSL